jgi:hypothetical protein
MARFMLLYTGPATPPDASHEGWPEWFEALGERLVDKGSQIAGGTALRGDGRTSDPPARLNGYSIIQAEGLDEALGLVRDHPFLTQGPEYPVQLWSLP